MLNWRRLLLLAVLGFLVSGGIAYFQKSPGYMDADYYFAGGIQLATGKGFTAPYLWNYMDNPDSLPHPSHSYWMPLASIIAAIGMKIAGQNTWFAGRILFLIVAASIPIITSTLAYSISKRRDLALISGMLSIFAGYYSAFMPVTDTFGIYIVLGGIFFLIAHRQEIWISFGLGVIAGLMHLTRADGIYWLLISFLIILFRTSNKTSGTKYNNKTFMGVLCLFGYLLIMGAWFIRNNQVFGSFLAPGGGSLFWFTNYNQIFSYPAGSFTFASWVENGLVEALKVRLWALSINMQNTLASQMSVFLSPLILIGIWKLRKDIRIIVAVTAWIGYLILMSFVFPFAGARGGFFHSGAALQPMWWALAPIGLVVIVEWVGNKRAWKIKDASQIFLWAIVGLAVLFTSYVVIGKLVNLNDGRNIWSKEYFLYKKVDILIDSPLSSNPIVIVANPPGYYLATGRSTIAIPDGNEQISLLVARRFGADYLVLEKEGIPNGLNGLYNNPYQYPDFNYLGELEGTRVFRIHP